MCELSVIIVNWNSREYLRRCLVTLFASPPRMSFEVIVIDSGSFDGCDEMLRAHFAQVHFLQRHDNVGFAAANNIGAETATGRTLLFLNPDTEIHAGAIDRLHQSLEALPNAGVVGPRLLNTDGSLQRSCVQPMPTILNQLLDIDFLQRLFPHRRIWLTAAAFEDRREPVPVEAVSGACMMMRKDLFERVGRFSTDYFMYAEDLDLCWKLHCIGRKNYYAPTANVVHHGGGSTQNGRSHFADVMIPESLSRLLCKTRGRRYSLGYRWALSISALCRIALIAFTFPAGVLARRTRYLNIALRKWTAVLRWGLGVEKWVKRFGHTDGA
jgi:hypothetical protein